MTVRSFGAALLLHATGQSDGQVRGFVYCSGDGGASWSYVATVPAGTAFVTASRWLAIARGGDWQETTDGGTTWHAYATDYTQAAPVAPVIVFGDEQVGYATVRGVIRRTVDGGAHWTTVSTPGAAR